MSNTPKIITPQISTPQIATPRVITLDMIQNAIDLVPYAKTLGIEPYSVEETLTMVMPYRQDNIGNPTLPALHGGGVGGFMEMAAIIQIILEDGQTDLSQKRFPKPIGLNIDYLRRGNPVDTYARAQIFKKGNRVANVRVRAWQDGFDNPIAALTGHFLMSQVPTKPPKTNG